MNTNEQERWADVPSEPMFQASSLGRIRWKDGGSLKHQFSLSKRSPYPVIRIGKRKKLVHRLVMEAFTGPSTLEVNHKNGIKQDGRLDNLEYVTHSENVSHAYRTGLSDAVRRASSNAMKKAHAEGRIPYSHGTTHYMSKLTNETAREVKALIASGVPSPTIARTYGVERSTINQIKRGRSWKHV